MGAPSTVIHRVLVLSAACLVLCIPFLASAVSTWNPTLLVNTESFQVIDDTDTTANVELRFGESLDARITYDRTVARFDFSKGAVIRGPLTVTGSLYIKPLTTSGGILYSSGAQVKLNATGGTGQILLSQGMRAPLWVTPTSTMVWYLDDDLTATPNQGAQVTMPFPFTATSVKLNIKGAPTGAALIVDIKKDGTTIFGTKPQIDAAATTGGSSAVFSVTALTQDSVISVDITQVGSTFAGSGLTILLNGTRKY